MDASVEYHLLTEVLRVRVKRRLWILAQFLLPITGTGEEFFG